MFIDSWNGNIKQRSHQFLHQPDCFILVTGFNTLFTSLAGKDQEFCCAIAD